MKPEPLILGEDEIAELTGYQQPAKQLAELHRLGFWRARRRAISGRVVLERAHYEAVCGAEATRKAPAEREPRLRLA